LQAPGFQNFALDNYPFFCQGFPQEGPRWPDIEDVRLVYRLTADDSKLRTFFAHAVVCSSPFLQYSEDEPEYEAWSKLLKELPGLALEMAQLEGKLLRIGNVIPPWYDENIDMYKEKELPLYQVWKGQILEARNLEEITEAAEKGCIRIKVELDHINRNNADEA
jgi:hypothetical protein